MKKRNLLKILNISILCLCSSMLIVNQLSSVSNLIVKADSTTNDVIENSLSSDWFIPENSEGQGTWTVTDNAVSVDAFNTNYAMEGATYLTSKGTALGAFEFETLITIDELNNVQNPMVGIIPWYLDEDNYLYVQLKMTNDAKYVLSDEEKSDGYAIEQIILSGRYNGEAKYYTATSQQENTTYDSLIISSLKNAKQAPKNSNGHKIKVRFENNSATATCYNITISYNDVEIGTSSAYFYNAIAKNLSVGYMAQDVKATFKNSVINDFVAENTNTVLARDFIENNGFTYRVLNNIDPWTFNDDNTISFVTDEIKPNGSTKAKSSYGVSGTNIAGYDTNRGFIDNPYKENSEGLPQNYEVSATFKLDEIPEFTGKKITQGYGLLAWYKDEHNFVDATFKRTVSGSKLSPKYSYQISLFGWIECSSVNVGTNLYDLPSDFDFSSEHTLTVQKKSNGFYVFLDDITNPILSKIIKGTETNYYYGYEGYNAKFSASKITSKPIYESYDEIAVLDGNNTAWRVSAKQSNSWNFVNNQITIDAKQTDDTLTARSYILGVSDISDKNMTLQVKANIELGDKGHSELMLAPYIVDENNYARIGLVFKNGNTYARIRACTYTEDDIDEDRDPKLTLIETKINDIDLSKEIIVKAEKIDNTLALYVNNSLVYGKVIADINVKSEDYGVYIYNMDLTINSLETIGYKKYDLTEVNGWTTSGMKYNEWTIDENGYLIGDATYTDDMQKDEKDAEKNFAIKENTFKDNYELTVTVKATKQSEAEDRIGVVMWYLDENNFMMFYIDHWRSDSSVPRTTIYGRIDGETLPTTYNHGGWFAEGEKPLENGMTQTEMSQVTNDHTIKIIKQNNTFTCYVDSNTNGYISYTVAAGLPDTTDKVVYSGIYTYNDEITVSAYDVTAIGNFTSSHLPNEANNPYNASISAPQLSTYDETTYEDEFDNISGSIDTPVTPDNPSEIPSNDTTSESKDNDKTPTTTEKGCKGSVGMSFISLIMLAGVLVTLKKKENN